MFNDGSTGPSKNIAAPRLSIGLPVFNGERYLAETIRSLLEQTFTDFELIIADNASTDATEAIARESAERDSRVRYHRSPTNVGAARNFNRAFELARGTYFKWAAHDDLHHPEFLAKCVAALDARPEVVLCFARTAFIDQEGAFLREYKFPVSVDVASTPDLFLLYAIGGHIVHEIFGVIRVDALKSSPLIGPYVGSDHVLLGTLSLKGRFHQVPEMLFSHREHPGRSTLATGGARGYTRWFDPSKSGRFVMPHWRRIFENSKSVSASDLALGDKLGCFWNICRAANWNRGALLDDMTNLVRSRAST